MIQRKTQEEIALMREGGEKLGNILVQLLDFSQPGISNNEIEALAVELIAQTGGEASFKTVKGYGWATCLCVNEIVVHGVPSSYILLNGDILTIDIGLLYKGFHTDTAWTKIIGVDTSKEKEQKEKFLQVGRETLFKAIGLSRIGNRIGDLSLSNQTIIEGAGYSVVKSLVGHGVGRELHEDPQIPNYLRGDRENTYQFRGGETIAIEPIYAQGNGSVVYENTDGWSIATRDRSLSAVFEHTIAISEAGPVILTQAPAPAGST
jgi:methionyl aminopeptidase